MIDPKKNLILIYSDIVKCFWDEKSSEKVKMNMNLNYLGINTASDPLHGVTRLSESNIC